MESELYSKKLSIDLINSIARNYYVHSSLEEKREIDFLIRNEIRRDFPELSDSVIETICCTYKSSSFLNISDIVVLEDVVFTILTNKEGEIVERRVNNTSNKRHYKPILEKDIPCTLYMAERIGEFSIANEIFKTLAKKIHDISGINLLINFDECENKNIEQIFLNCDLFDIVEAYANKAEFEFELAFFNPLEKKYMHFTIQNSYKENVLLKFVGYNDDSLSIKDELDNRRKQYSKQMD